MDVIIMYKIYLKMYSMAKEMATHSSVLAWRIPGAGDPGGLPSMGSHRVWHDWSNLAAAAASWGTVAFVQLPTTLTLKENAGLGDRTLAGDRDTGSKVTWHLTIN